MNLKWTLLPVFLILFASCQKVKDTEKPENLIPEDKMVDVLTDLTILNSAKNYNRRILEATGMKPDVYLYKKHQIDSLQLAKSTEYYAQKFDVYENINNRVRRNLNKIKTELEEQRRIEDSIQREKIKKDTLPRDKELKAYPDSLITPGSLYEEYEESAL